MGRTIPSNGSNKRVMGTMRAFMLGLASFALVSCTTAGKTKVSVDYYLVSGETSKQLDQQILKNGPKIDGNAHAIALARIKMLPNVRYKIIGNRCVVSSATVSVDAKVTLPKWRERYRANAKLGEQWDNLDRYARAHESIHVLIATKWSKELEERFRNQPPAPTCSAAERLSLSIFRATLKQHEREQLQFDASEKKRLLRLARKSRRQAKS